MFSLLRKIAAEDSLRGPIPVGPAVRRNVHFITVICEIRGDPKPDLTPARPPVCKTLLKQGNTPSVGPYSLLWPENTALSLWTVWKTHVAENCSGNALPYGLDVRRLHAEWSHATIAPIGAAAAEPAATGALRLGGARSCVGRCVPSSSISGHAAAPFKITRPTAPCGPITT